MHKLVKEIACDCRVGKEGKVNEKLPVFTNKLFALIETGRVDIRPDELNILIEGMLSAQSRGDFICLADSMEFKLLPYIRA